MKLDLTDEQRLMAETAERFFRDAGTLAEARRVGDGWAAPLWRAAHAMGFVTMRVPAASGGIDTGLMEAVLVCEAAGRAAAPIPLADGIAAARLLAALGGDAAAARLAALADGPLAFAEPHVDRIEAAGDAVVVRAAGGGTIRLAQGADALARFGAAQAERSVLRAAWLAGAAAQAIGLAAAYATERKQFDRPIGSFQGVALPLADAITDIEAGRLLVWRAVWAIAAARPDAAATIAMADWWLATAARRAVRQSLRTFGGYGLSTEYDIHLYFLAINRVALADGDPEARLAVAGDRLWGDGDGGVLPHAGDPGIDMGLGARAEAYADEARAFFARAMTPDLRAKAHHGTDGHDPAFHRELAAAGLAYPDWPARWGGEDRGAMEITALGRVFEENRWTRVPIGCTNMGARMIMRFGTPALQAEVLPRLAAGDALSCLGFTEPETGSDMYGARTRAVRDGDDWILTGQKMFTTGAHLSHYVLMIARTDPAKAKHRGLTIFFVPMDLPGVSIQPVHTLQDERTNITFYDGVRIPDRYRLGEVDGGLAVMAAAMEIEHGGEGYHIHHRSLMEAALAWAFEEKEGRRPIDDRAVRTRLAKVATHVSLADLLCRRATQAGEEGTLTRAGGPMAKLFATESYMADAADLVALAAPASLAHATPALTEIEEFHRQSIGQTIYGGTSEVHRTIIAQHALGLPRST